ncbi:MAG: nucleotide exchange factor GrpE [Chloroflexi bacterium]|nr:nucleotide exchange factor GrpE [Chloroflexota bacterium]
MDERRGLRIPVQVKRRGEAGGGGSAAGENPPTPDVEPAAEQGAVCEAEAQAELQALTGKLAEKEEELASWQDRALRLQAEMDNFRKLQRRIADDQVQTERERLLRAFLRVGDDLERALRAAEADPGAILEGVRLIHQSFMLVLQQHDVLPIDAQGQAFDPNRHEAVTMTPAPAGAEGEPRVAEVLETGYVLGDRLLRPAKVVVQR